MGAPVGARDTCAELTGLADEVVCARVPDPFSAVGQWYVDFDQTTDDEVKRLLQDHAKLTRKIVGQPLRGLGTDVALTPPGFAPAGLRRLRRGRVM